MNGRQLRNRQNAKNALIQNRKRWREAGKSFIFYGHESSETAAGQMQSPPAPTVPLFGHLKPLPQSLSLEEARLQFQRNNRLANSRKVR